MHAGNIESAKTAAGRLYRAFGRRGYWHSAAVLAARIGTTCLSTRIAEVRAQLPRGERIEVACRGIGRWFYRLVVES